MARDLIDEVLEEMRTLLEGGNGARGTERGRLSKELAAAEVKVERYADAIAAAGSVPTVVARLKAAEEHRQALGLL